MKVVTFDFDHTLLFEIGEPNEEGIAHFRRHMAAGDECHVVTSRISANQVMAREIPDFLKAHGLKAESIVFTEGHDKLGHLRKLGSDLHFDDDEHEIALCRNAGIECVHVFSQDKWNEFMDRINR